MSSKSLGRDIDESLQVYISRLIRRAEKKIEHLNPAHEEFRALVEGDTMLRTLSS